MLVEEKVQLVSQTAITIDAIGMVPGVGQAEFFLRVKQTLGRSASRPAARARRPPTQVRPITTPRVCVLRSTIKLLSLGLHRLATAHTSVCVCAIIVICCSSNRKRSALVCVCKFFISG